MTAERIWEIPEPLAAVEVRLDDGTVTTLRRHGNPKGPRLILSHGNGLAIDLYYPFWSLLVADFDLVVYDLRNHGWNALSARSAHSLPTFVRDHDLLFEVVDIHFGAKPKIGVFHSISALVTLLSSATKGRYAARVLFDPPVCKPGHTEVEFDAVFERTAKLIRRWASRFRTLSDFTHAVRRPPAFKRVVPGVHELMARTTLRRSADADGYELRCPKEYEAQIIQYGRAFTALVDFDTPACPTKVVGSDPTLPHSYLPTVELRQLVNVGYDFIPETTHFLPLENPEACAAATRAFVKRQGLY